MSDLEARLRAVVDARRYMTLATADSRATPWASPVWYAHYVEASAERVDGPDLESAIAVLRGEGDRRIAVPLGR